MRTLTLLIAVALTIGGAGSAHALFDAQQAVAGAGAAYGSAPPAPSAPTPAVIVQQPPQSWYRETYRFEKDGAGKLIIVKNRR